MTVAMSWTRDLQSRESDCASDCETGSVRHLLEWNCIAACLMGVHLNLKLGVFFHLPEIYQNSDVSTCSCRWSKLPTRVLALNEHLAYIPEKPAQQSAQETVLRRLGIRQQETTCPNSKL